MHRYKRFNSTSFAGFRPFIGASLMQSLPLPPLLPVPTYMDLIDAITDLLFIVNGDR